MSDEDQQRPRGPIGWFVALIQGALAAAIAIAGALVAGAFQAVLNPPKPEEEPIEEE